MALPAGTPPGPLTIPREHHQIIEANVARQLVGQVIGATTGSVPILVYPNRASGGIRSMAVQVQVATAGLTVFVTTDTNGAVAPVGTQQVPPNSGFAVVGSALINLNPGVDTIFVLPILSTVFLNWIVGG